MTLRILLPGVLLVALCASGKAAEPSLRPTDPLSRAANEFKVLTGQWGMRPDGTVAQKTGPRLLWHGRISENFRNDILDAIPHEVAQNGGNKSLLRRNQFSFNVAGPLLVPKLIRDPNNTFIMVSYEGVRERISKASLHTIPTIAERTGDFSQTVDQAGLPLPIYDPASTSVNPAWDPSQPVSANNLQYLRDPFPGNRIPGIRLAPAIQRALALYPLPNINIGPFFQNNYFVNSPQTDTADGFIFKLDHPFATRHRLTSTSVISNGFLGSAKYFPNLASPTPPDQTFTDRRTRFDYAYTASAKTVYSASVVARSTITGTGDPSQPAFPRYELGNYLWMGTQYPQTRNARINYEADGGATTRYGKHSFQAAFQGNLRQVNSFNPAYPSGDFQFGSGLTSLPGVIDTGMPFASFLLSLPQYGEHTVISSPSYFRNSYAALSGTDKYALSKDLTITIGLNLSLRTPRTEKYDRQSTIDPAIIDPATGHLGALVFAGRNGFSRGLRPGNLDIDPSVGIAWNPLGHANTVVRANFARSHSPVPIYNGQWATQGFNARQTFVSANTQLSPALDLAAGIPPLPTPLPDLNPATVDSAVADFMDLSRREPVYQSASLSIEREVPFSMVITAGATYSGGRDLLVGNTAANPNAISPDYLGYGNALYDQSFRTSLQPFPQFTGFDLFGLYPAGRYQRDAGFLSVEKRASYGLSFMATYQFSKQLDDYSSPYGNQDFFHLRNDWAVTASSVPQTLSLSYIYELPFGSGKPLLHFSDWKRQLVSGWSISGAGSWGDGKPLTMHPEFNNTGNILSALNVDVVPGVDRHVANPGPSLWFNPAAFTQPADFTLGNGSPTQPDVLGPSFYTMDLSVNKRLPVGGDRTVELSASAFDFLNHANWNPPDTAIGPDNAPNVNAGRIIGSQGGRVVQLGVKLTF